ncbi:MAG: ABC transporter ATP-binding protein [Methanosarcina sp.]|uniref:ATP-binding cassette domain-containing protein n=1 Tax=Methanosarcina sp. TaxID=2213 RepID=UPI00262B7A46|nr:ABC transporter ATP-binding protein [Methanosarcina sp.]MDD3245984.1 ABC transporter ATP-binding protein [Methanosarcina sp.]
MRLKMRKLGNKEDLDYVLELLELLELLGMMEFAMKDIYEISGGQQQKELIARALAQKADILLLDEPTSNLDIRHQFEVMEIMKDIMKNKGISAVMALHDLNLALRYADRIIMMKGAKYLPPGILLQSSP